MESGQLLLFLLMSVPALALLVLCVLWLGFAVKRRLLGLVGVVLIGAALQTGQRYSIWLFLLLFCSGVFACVRASIAKELLIPNKDS